MKISLVSSHRVASMILKTTTESPMISPIGFTKCPAMRIKIINPLAINRRKYFAITTLWEERCGGVSALCNVRANRWKFVVTSRPPQKIPMPKSKGRSKKPAILVIINKIQLVRVTNVSIRC